MNPKEYSKGKSGSTHRDADKVNEVKSTTPCAGDTLNNPGEGGALTRIITLDVEVKPESEPNKVMMRMIINQFKLDIGRSIYKA
jgi:hypothetical protein